MANVTIMASVNYGKCNLCHVTYGKSTMARVMKLSLKQS